MIITELSLTCIFSRGRKTYLFPTSLSNAYSRYVKKKTGCYFRHGSCEMGYFLWVSISTCLLTAHSGEMTSINTDSKKPFVAPEHPNTLGQPKDFFAPTTNNKNSGSRSEVSIFNRRVDFLSSNVPLFHESNTRTTGKLFSLYMYIRLHMVMVAMELRFMGERKGQ